MVFVIVPIEQLDKNGNQNVKKKPNIVLKKIGS